MRKLAVCFCLLFLVPAFTFTVRAQETAKAPDAAKAPSEPDHFYRLNFVLEELDASGKPVNSRSFATTISTARSGFYNTISTGSKVPVATSAVDQSGNVQTQVQYIDVGVKITARDIHEIAGRLSFILRTEVSSVGAMTGQATLTDPALNQNNWDGAVLISIGKPTVVFKSDDLDNKGAMQVEVTATPVE